MTKLVEDEELRRLRAVVEGSKPFVESGLWEKIVALDQREFMKLDARTRLACGYYVAGRRRYEQLQDAAP